jgi:ABC-2 type transport system permease protein
MIELNAIITIAFRDVLKFLRDRARLLSTFIFPFIFIGVLGGSLQSNLSNAVGYNFITFVFTGALAQTIFQSTASGLISLIEDRESDFSQEIFISPISRYSIVIGKIFGETLVSMIQGVGIVLFSLILGVTFTWQQLIVMVPVALVACFLGGAFGLLVLSQLNNQRAANQIFPFILLPQFFLAGTFTPIKDLPLYLWILSRIAPMTYAVDLVRGVYYWGTPEYSKVVLHSPWVNLAIIVGMSLVFLLVGTYMFVRKEKNR